AKPTEFGRRVKIQEAEGQFITDYAVCEPGTSDCDLWLPSLDRHIVLFARPPDLAVADGGIRLAHERNGRAGAGRAPGGASEAIARVPLAERPRRLALADRE